MAEFELRFKVPASVSRDLARTTFFWTTSEASSFNTYLRHTTGRIGPRLGTLGPVRTANVDLARIAAMVFAADRSVPRARGRLNWSRRPIGLSVPVSDPDAWTAVADDLTALLNFLSGDEWTLTFRRGLPPKEKIRPVDYSDVELTVLLSGGADSAVGGYLARTRGVNHLLVSHIGATTISPVQESVAKQIRALSPDGGMQQHRQITFTRHATQPGGVALPDEFTTRTRSLLFLALGLANASISETPLWIPENGFASLNPPLGADQLGSLSTRTTHPWFLSELSRIAALAGAHADIVNPFADRTKGEMFRWLADEVGDDAASKFLSSTNSCANTNRRFSKLSSKDHCGVCFGCLVRRASFLAAGLNDSTTYVADNPPGASVAENLRKLSMRPSIEGFVTRGLSVGDIAAMRLPAGYRASTALALCERGLAELELLL